jgi:hypothetical protein
MKVIESTVRTLKISELENLDPISVYLENFEPGKGKITIECYGKSWSSYWPAMGGTIEEFFMGISEDYAVNNLQHMSSRIFDDEATERAVAKEILIARKSGNLTSYEAREALEEISGYESNMDYINSRSKAMSMILGDEPWFYDFKEKPNPDYIYLCRIIKAVQESLMSVIK